jgi:hypothetical protein
MVIGKPELNPYIGPRPFTRNPEDKIRFFGRDNETNEIVYLTLRHKLTLVYAQGGSGKTSILNARVIPVLEEEYRCEVLPVGRIGRGPNASIEVSHIPNIYIFNLLQSLNTEAEPQSLVNMSLSIFLEEYFPNHKDESGDLIPQVLILDQLEDLFNLYAAGWQDQRVGFFQQLAEALKDNRPLRIILIIREDYLAQLDPSLDILPERLRPRFRLERLNKEAAFTAIKGPLEAMRVFDKERGEEVENDIKRLVEDLLRIRVETYDGRSQEVQGEFVEPIHLQVVCTRWWQQRLSSKDHSIDSMDVDNTLEDFYVEAIIEATKQTGVAESEIREWIEKTLITSSGTRSIVHHEQKSTGKMPNEVVDVLEAKYLIRADRRSGARWYELTHDRLIEPIKNSNKKYYSERHDNRSLKNMFFRKNRNHQY